MGGVTGAAGGAAGTAVPAAAQGTASAGAASPGGALGQTAFLQLLVAEMQNQDPMNPMDSTTFVTQLAQFQMLDDLNTIQTDMGELVAAAHQGTSASGTGSGGGAGGGAAPAASGSGGTG